MNSRIPSIPRMECDIRDVASRHFDDEAGSFSQDPRRGLRDAASRCADKGIGRFA
jgi:hypothetical protein